MSKQIIRAFAIDNPSARLKAIAVLAKRDSKRTFDFLIEKIESEDEDVASRASQALVVFRELLPNQISSLVRNLRANKFDFVRLSCAIKLMSEPCPEVNAAFLNALGDPFEKVAQIACIEAGEWGGAEGTRGLFRALKRREWNVRLSACKALIQQGNADLSVLEALKQLQREPESAQFDEDANEYLDLMESLNTEVTVVGESIPLWGTLDSIIAEAVKISTQKQG